MSRTNPLPPELIALETRLRGLPFPMAKLSHAETMFQCGWAAAETHHRFVGAKRGWFWPATSGVLAASVLVLAMFLPSDANTSPVAHRVPPTILAVEDSERQPEVAPSAAQSKPAPTISRHFAPEDQSLLAVRDRALRGIFVEPTRTVQQVNLSSRQPKTSRDLLDEMLKRNINS